MRAFLKLAVVAFGVTGALAAAPARAQPYDDGYYDDAYGDEAYDDGYGDPAYGDPAYDAYAQQDSYADPYCDAYGCPDDYYDLPVYYGDYYYGGSWLSGPLYYRTFGGARQFWIHGGWRSAQYRGGRFGPALGRNQYRGYRGGYARNYNYGNRGSYGSRSFSQGTGRNNAWQGNRYNNRYSGGYTGQRSYGNRDGNRGGNWQRQNRQNNAVIQSAPQRQPQASGSNWRGRGDFGRWSAQRQSQRQSAQPQASQQRSYPDRSGRISGGNRGGDRGERRGRN